MDLLRFATAGSVDDGKSTLIGRLLYDSNALLDDQIIALQKTSGIGFDLNLATLTDGLREEREKGITIDVAYRYFGTDTRKFILSDCPGHSEFTSNFISGVSNVDALVLLVDATLGVREQTRRHMTLASLLGVPHLVVCINKVDLIGYDLVRYRALEAELSAMADKVEFESRRFLPLSARNGDNVVFRSKVMSEISTPSLLEILEALPPRIRTGRGQLDPPRLRVSSRLGDSAYAVKVVSGRVETHNQLQALTATGLSSCGIRKLWLGQSTLASASAGQQISAEVSTERALERGDWIFGPGVEVTKKFEFSARLCWMDASPLVLGREYLLMNGAEALPVAVHNTHRRFSLEHLQWHDAEGPVTERDIVETRLRVPRGIFVENYRSSRATGAFVLIDPESHRTCAGGMVTATSDFEHARIS